MRTTTLLVAALVVLSGCSFLGGAPPTDGRADPRETASATPTPTATPAGTPTPTATPAAFDYADPAGDRLGWEGGYWYNESLAVDGSDGLDETELDAVVNRSMARVEQIRRLEFDRSVPVAVVSPSEYAGAITSGSGTVSPEQRLHQNVKWEATFYLNESTDALAARRAFFTNGTGGFYDPRSDEIRIVAENASSADVREAVLGHELVHALQDQQFNTTYNRSTTDANHGAEGIVEGDADYVEALYQRRCEAAWDCLSPESSQSPPDVNVGLQINGLVPYSEGSEFVQSRYENGSWAAVDAIYRDPPATAEQVIHRDAYPDERGAPLRINHTASDGWAKLDLAGGVDHATFGEGTMFAMFWYASFQATREAGTPRTVVVPYRSLFNFEPGTTELRDVGPYDYNHPVTEGWNGDRLVPYVNDTSAATSETGYVWKTSWDSTADAREFERAYERLLTYRGARSVDGRANTYRIPEDREFGDAFYVTRNGTEVVVVNAPTVADLDSVRAGAAPETGG